MFKFIFYSLIFYFLLKAVRIVIRYFSLLSSKQKQEIDVKVNKPDYKVDKRDIVEAEFEEIIDKDEK